MEQKYRAITKDMNPTFVSGDQRRLKDGGAWVNMVEVNHNYYIRHGDFFNYEYRRPITPQYVYENAGFRNGVSSFQQYLARVASGELFFDGKGSQVYIEEDTSEIRIRLHSGIPFSITDLHTRKPVLRMMQINGVELVAPETEEPIAGTKFYYINKGSIHLGSYGMYKWHKDLFMNVGIWLKEEHCKQAIDAMQKVFFGGES